MKHKPVSLEELQKYTDVWRDVVPAHPYRRLAESYRHLVEAAHEAADGVPCAFNPECPPDEPGCTYCALRAALPPKKEESRA